MKFEDTLRERIGGKTGFILPEGSLEEVYRKVSAELPERKLLDKPKVTMWQKVRPYIYMAAMFAGIWCMMKMFHTMSSSEISLDNPPQFVAEAIMELPAEDEDIYSVSDLTDFELEQEISEKYSSIEDFERDFGYELKPQYANIELNESTNSDMASR